jgi:hypothetical protein
VIEVVPMAITSVKRQTVGAAFVEEKMMVSC